MTLLRKKIPSALMIYNTFHRTYFKYFHGHYTKKINTLSPEINNFFQHFIDAQFHKLSFSLDKYEKYLLWLFSKEGKLGLFMAHGRIDEYLEEENKSVDISPFSGIICKYIREEGIHSWKEYLLPQDGFYPKIVQHYMRDRSFPFEFILFLNIIDRIPEHQKKMVKSIFRRELYNLNDRLEVVKKNKGFFIEEMKKINESFR